MLPVELLERILLYAVTTNQGVVNTRRVHQLALVSKTWRILVLRHPGFWTSITVSIYTSYQSHKQLDLLEDRLKRSRSLLLDVVWEISSDCEQLIPDIVSRFASYGGFVRWRTLVTRDWPSLTLDDIAELGPLHNLTELTLKTQISQRFFDHILCTATQLRKLDVNGGGRDLSLQYSQLFPRITHFTGPLHPPNWHAQKFHNLRHLEVTHPTDGLTPDVLEGLHSLILRGTCVVDRAGRNAPNLRELTLEGYARRAIQVIRAPNLECITLRSVYELSHIMQGLKDILGNSPRLRRLCLRTPVELGDLRSLRGHVGDNIEEVSICMDLRSSATYGDIASAFVERFPWSRNPAEDGDGEVLFPRLKSLEIFAAYSGAISDIYCGLAKRLLQGRVGTQLEFVSCRVDGERVFIASKRDL
ncbi:SubName: Full=Uncharacterized protein {ECO:0000313/EMBL:CCA70794.1} [Serendipita indica DSM 11827]|uniref:Uncharacterized protein n=1 Tax=Serendipita indica (strain DSM 11827) TaxID=1109443 RepID=G4THK1_SERID|nr:SubName: Full=Uncharacterized protein {ECO:0000313/EMBL:CCA70794.1} [Serendipita indica DSM 11827]CCA70794.1 hypothetical protein PIIN_04729 [Serendipita indica DSM 11827]